MTKRATKKGLSWCFKAECWLQVCQSEPSLLEHLFLLTPIFMLLLNPWTLVRTCSSNFDTLSNNDQLLVQSLWLRLRCGDSILNALYQEQKVDDEEWDKTVRRKLLRYCISQDPKAERQVQTYTFSTQRSKALRRTNSTLPSTRPSLNSIRLTRSRGIRNGKYDQSNKRCNRGSRHEYRCCPFDHLVRVVIVSTYSWYRQTNKRTLPRVLLPAMTRPTEMRSRAKTTQEPAMTAIRPLVSKCACHTGSHQGFEACSER